MPGLKRPGIPVQDQDTGKYNDVKGRDLEGGLLSAPAMYRSISVRLFCIYRMENLRF
jgi:hypothetical protein